MMNPTLYTISGLGTDDRIFGRINWPGEMRYIAWKAPYSGESLKAYARRMAMEIPAEIEPVICGLSFGGVIAQEIARIRPVKKLILISTITSAKELPPIMRTFRYVPLYQLSRGKWRIRMLPYWAPRFGIRDKSELALIVSMFSKFSDSCRMWAIRQLVHWEGQELPHVAISRLHGSRDRVFPVKYLRKHDCIPGGNHFMVYQCAQEVSAWIRQVYSSL